MATIMYPRPLFVARPCGTLDLFKKFIGKPIDEEIKQRLTEIAVQEIDGL